MNKYRYSSENNNSAKICAIRFWPANTIFYALNGYTSDLSNAEIQYLAENRLDFSITYSGKKNTMQLWLGPGAYVNHACNPNSKIYCNKTNGELCLKSIRDIIIRKEITWDYGRDYFDVGECICLSCTKKV